MENPPEKDNEKQGNSDNNKNINENNESNKDKNEQNEKENNLPTYEEFNNMIDNLRKKLLLSKEETRKHRRQYSYFPSQISTEKNNIDNTNGMNNNVYLGKYSALLSVFDKNYLKPNKNVINRKNETNSIREKNSEKIATTKPKRSLFYMGSFRNLIGSPSVEPSSLTMRTMRSPHQKENKKYTKFLNATHNNKFKYGVVDKFCIKRDKQKEKSMDRTKLNYDKKYFEDKLVNLNKKLFGVRCFNFSQKKNKNIDDFFSNW